MGPQVLEASQCDDNFRAWKMFYRSIEVLLDIETAAHI